MIVGQLGVIAMDDHEGWPQRDHRVWFGVLSPAWVALLVATLMLAACGGGSEGTPLAQLTQALATPTAEATLAVPPPGIAAVAPELTLFGALAAVHSPPVTVTVDSAASSLSLADGAAIEVPPGAFPVPAELTAVIIDVDLGINLTDQSEVRIYRLSTEEDIALGVPVVLEVPKSADSVSVHQLVGGEWLPVDVPDGPTTRIEIPHFSTVTVAVSDGIFDDQPGDAISRGSADTALDDFFQCVNSVGALRPESRLESDFFFQRVIIEACAHALRDKIDEYPEDNVDVQCVYEATTSDVTQAVDDCPAVANPDEPEPECPEQDMSNLCNWVFFAGMGTVEQYFEGPDETCTVEAELEVRVARDGTANGLLYGNSKNVGNGCETLTSAVAFNGTWEGTWEPLSGSLDLKVVDILERDELPDKLSGSFTAQQVFIALDEINAPGSTWFTTLGGCAETDAGQGTCE